MRGPHVNRGYIGDDEAVRRLKMPDPSNGGLWHRTGDLARFDDQGRLWLTGRVPDLISHHGRRLYPYVIEAELSEAVPQAQLLALISHPGAPQGEVVLTCADADSEAALAAARAALQRSDLAALPVRRVAGIPVDARHNSKIDRPLLRAQLSEETR